MARVVDKHDRKAVAVNPVKNSQPLGGTLAFLGLDRCMPVLHGSQGCTAFAKALLVRHFREAIPLQSTALTEVAVVLGDGENLVDALAAVSRRQRPDVIGLLSTGLTETRGDDVARILEDYREFHPEYAHIPVVHASTPDYKGALQDGYAGAVEAILRDLALPAAAGGDPVRGQVNLLLGPALAPLDAEEIRETVAAFGLDAIVLPDLSGSLDGHAQEDWSPLTTGGTRVADIRRMGRSALTLVFGESLRDAGRVLAQGSGVPYRVFDRVTGLGPVDDLLSFLADWTGRSVPERLRRERRRLVDGMLDAHFFLGGKRIALAMEPDLLWAVGCWLAEAGAELAVAVTSTRSPLLERLPCPEVVVGDFADLEERAAGADILVASSHGRQSAERLGIPIFRLGFPVFDRLGAQYRCTAGYRGSLSLLFEVANALMEQEHRTAPAGGGNGRPPAARGAEVREG